VMAFSKYALCIDCHHGYTREHGPQRRCSTCQAVHEQEMAAVYKKRHRAKQHGNHNEELERVTGFYTIVNDPLQPDWHGKIPEGQVFEGCRLATFSEGTKLRRGRKLYIVVGKTAPLYGKATGVRTPKAQRLEEL